MRQLASLFLCFLLTVTLLWTSTGPAHAVSYDFNALSGSDTSPYANPNGQDNWTSEGFIFSSPISSWFVGVSQTLGFDGTQALRFDRIGPGYGADASRINDGAFAIPTFAGLVTEAFFQADFGVGHWGNLFALGYDANTDSKIRKTTPNEIGPRLIIGSQSDVGVQVMDATGTITKVPLSNVSAFGGHWVRLRLVMDFTANGGQGSGDVYFQNLTNGDTSLQPVTGLQDINLGLTPGSGDASDPANWNGMWGHMEGATNELDNILVETTMKLAIDIKPRHCPNKLKIKSDDDSSSSDDGSSGGKKGNLKVAILGTQDFDVRTIDVTTLSINGVSPVKSKFKDVTAPSALELCDCEKLPKDTYEDLELKFNRQDIIATLGTVQDGDAIELTLTGNLLESEGGTDIYGTDCVLIEVKGRHGGSSDDKSSGHKKHHHGSDDDSSSGHKKKKK